MQLRPTIILLGVAVETVGILSTTMAADLMVYQSPARGGCKAWPESAWL